jgi:hypothetical protein
MKRMAGTASGCMAVALLCAAAPAWFAAAQDLPTPAEPYAVTEVKAAFLYHFGTYVQWPEEMTTSAAMTIAVLGDAEVAAELARLLPGREIQGRPARVRRLRGIEELAGEEVLYIGPAENERLTEILAHVGERPTLVVTDAPDGLAAGGMINFRLVDDRVRFEIAVRPAERAGLTLSSRLLGAAERVETSPES